jgi:flavin-dependent dehydrogenase
MRAPYGEASGDAAVHAGFVVDATGPRSAFARRLGVARNVVDSLVSICAVVDTTGGGPAHDRTLVEASEHGWWYAAKIPGDRYVVSFTTDAEVARRRGLGGLRAWRDELSGTRLIAEELGAALATDVPTLTTVAAPVMILSAVIGARWLAVGDAASSYDPLGSAGITKALAHGLAAADAIADRLSGGGGALAGYQDGVFADFTEHVKLRHALYSSERRWPASPFWSARQRPIRGRRSGGTEDGERSARPAPAGPPI